MRVVFNVSQHELNLELLELIKVLISKNAEIVIKRESIILEEYDPNIPLKQVMQEFSHRNYHPDFLADLEKGLKSSSVYAR